MLWIGLSSLVLLAVIAYSSWRTEALLRGFAERPEPAAKVSPPPEITLTADTTAFTASMARLEARLEGLEQAVRLEPEPEPKPEPEPELPPEVTEALAAETEDEDEEPWQPATPPGMHREVAEDGTARWVDDAL